MQSDWEGTKEFLYYLYHCIIIISNDIPIFGKVSLQYILPAGMILHQCASAACMAYAGQTKERNEGVFVFHRTDQALPEQRQYPGKGGGTGGFGLPGSGDPDRDTEEREGCGHEIYIGGV